MLGPIEIGGIIVLGVVVCYLILGGFKACLVTDVFQCALLWALLLATPLIIIYHIGEGSLVAGWQEILKVITTMKGESFIHPLQTTGPQAPDLANTYPYVISLMAIYFLVLIFPSGIGGPRYLAAKNEKVARQGSLLAFGLSTLPYRIFISMLSLSYIAFTKVKGDELLTESLFFLYESGLLPMVVASLFFICLLAALMSNLDSNVMLNATGWLRDIYQLWINPKSKEKKLIGVGRVLIVVSVVLLFISVFLLPESMFRLNLALAGIMANMVFASTFGLYLMKRATKEGAIASIIAGVGVGYGVEMLVFGLGGQYK